MSYMLGVVKQHKTGESKMDKVDQMTTDQIKKEISKIKDLNNLQNEGSEGVFHSEERFYKLNQELDKRIFEIDWSLEKTIEKRQRWNDEIKKRHSEGRLNLAELINELGFNQYVLKEAIEFHKL